MSHPTKIVDLENKIKKATGVFLPLKNLEYFQKVALDDYHFSICWPNGADLCPDVLYHMGKDFSDKKKTPIKKKGVCCREKSLNILA